MKTCILTLMLILLSLGIKGQVISTIAGGGSSIGDGGAATAAILNNPGGNLFDKEGNLYIVEGSGNRIRKINTAGIISTVVGTGNSGYNGDGIPATSAELHNPFGLEVDSAGNIFIADCGNYRVRKVDAVSGIISTVAGTGVSGYNGDDMPATDAMITQPGDICLDKAGNLYITDNANYRIRKVSSAGIISTIAGNGTPGSSGDGGAATAAQFTLIYGIKTDKYGNIYVADWNGGRVRKINTSGVINTIAGTGSYSYNGDNIPATNANITPTRLALNGNGELYITDYTNHRIRKVDKAGMISTVAGTGVAGNSGDGGPATAAGLDGINGISTDTCGNLFISANFSRIRKVAVNPACIPLGLPVVNTTVTSMQISPNPANSELTITAPQEIKSVRVVDMMGRETSPSLSEGEVNSNERSVPVDVSHLPAGVYVVRVNGVYFRRFVKE